MRTREVLILAAVLAATTAANAADYRAGQAYLAAPPIRPAPPLYYVAAPPHYVQDLRSGQPGRWVASQPSFLDRLFGERDGY